MGGGGQGFKGSGENVYLFSGSWGVLVNIFRDGGSKFIVFGDFRSPAKKRLKNLTLKEKAFISFDFLKKIFGFSKETPLANLNVLTFVLTCESRLVLMSVMANNLCYCEKISLKLLNFRYLFRNTQNAPDCTVLIKKNWRSMLPDSLARI